MAYNIQFPCSRKWSGGRDKHCADVLTPLSLKQCRRILISCLVCFLRPVRNSEARKIPLLFLHLFIALERTVKTKNADTVFEPYYIGTFSPNLSQNGRKLDARELKTCAQFLENIVSRKRAKQLQRRSSGWTTRRESNYLRLTSKWLSLFHNNNAQMLTR